MPRKTEMALRELLDPYDVLPRVRLTPGAQTGKTDSTVFWMREELIPIGSLMLTPLTMRNGMPAMRIDSILLERPDPNDKYRQSAMIAALAVSSAERRALVSDDAGSSISEVQMWCGWACLELASIEERFVMRPDSPPGRPVFDGKAIAKPFTSIG